MTKKLSLYACPWCFIRKINSLLNFVCVYKLSSDDSNQVSILSWAYLINKCLHFRDAEVMREKQEKKAAAKATEGATGGK